MTQEKHCGHECVCNKYIDHTNTGATANRICNGETWMFKPCPNDTRTFIVERYTGVCALQDKCNDYADFIESNMDVLYDGDSDDPPCPIKCDHRKNPQEPAIAEIEKSVEDRIHKFYKPRMDALQEFQHELPEPYRTTLCDILANGKRSP